mmetsp:Transcript_128489/g.256676  ORF Transcript_128489/g.256676 Transcript_128489/m.256676 type:complete len:157 (-) Transcript_128489:86-556(-)|eukprot:CAMPEP_0172722970 /NCGR_PEP_ID=MMETSP1074-20121228/82684_1 /TAXON_ID=2916 /ORGANISM="Ceratium fusus, Strain PA161109" /LENGTH=156 /DNA_ID=CAMNT_0013549099 /DNA_START=72 /DNA_END=542 /DNA_ORIENTATION=+
MWCASCCHQDEKGAEVLTVDASRKPVGRLPAPEEASPVDPPNYAQQRIGQSAPGPDINEENFHPADDSEFRIVLHRDGEKDRIGLNVSHVAEGALTIALVVKEVKDGMVQKWNQDHPDVQVQAGHFIVACNGIRGNSAKMLQKIGSDKDLDLIIKR